MNDTIAAISTSLGVGAIAIIRVSGEESINITDKIFSKTLLNKESHTITYGYIKDKNELIDEVLITIMKAPKSFTVENVVEINCHGGIASTKKVLELLIQNGCRLAEPGEFTKRAFLNGRIDLTQAEAIMDMINIKSESARKIVMNNLKGKTTDKIRLLRQDILNIIANIEVNIDYPEYLDIEVITKEKIQLQLINLKEQLQLIIKNSNNSKIIKDGINVAIIGKPNVGKSSLLNTLMGEEKAIVTDIPGTTRDSIEVSINLDGIMLNLIDTAGIRNTDNIVEKIGVEKSLSALDKADLVIYVLNYNEKTTEEELALLKTIENKKKIVVINKNDLDKNIELENLYNYNIIYTNTVTEEGIEDLKEKIKTMFNLEEMDKKDFNYLSNIKQLSMLKDAEKSVDDIEKGIKENLPIDMLEIDLKNIFDILGEIIGESYNEELLDELFKNFCVGK